MTQYEIYLDFFLYLRIETANRKEIRDTQVGEFEIHQGWQEKSHFTFSMRCDL